MNHRIDRIHLSVALYFLIGLLCVASFIGCTGTNIITESKNAYGKVTISWDNVPGAISYNIYFSIAAGVTQWNSHKITSSVNSITVFDLDPGKTYYFAITVVDKSGESKILSEKSYPVTNKEGFINFGDLTQESQAAKELGPEGQVIMSWDNVPNAISYNIYYSDSPGVTKQNGKKIASVMSPFTIKGLERGKTYYFIVTAVTNIGESKGSEELPFTVNQ